MTSSLTLPLNTQTFFETEAKIMDEHLLHFITKGLPPAMIDQAMTDCFPHEIRDQIPNPQDFFDFFILPWILYYWVPLDSYGSETFNPDLSPAKNYFLSNQNILNEAERSYMEIIINAHHSFYQILSLEAEQPAHLEDLFLGTTHTITLPADHPWEAGDILYARLLTLSDRSILTAEAPYPMPSEWRDVILEFKSNLSKDPVIDIKTITATHLKEVLAPVLLNCYLNPFRPDNQAS